MAKDLVCGMIVDEKNPEIPVLEYKGVYYYFCTNLCLVQFQAHPEKYIHAPKQHPPEQHKGHGNPH